jgi:hypothetical protein
MEIIAWAALIVILIVGYSVYRGYQERSLAKRLKAMRDKNLIGSEMDAAINQVKAEAEFWRRNSRF